MTIITNWKASISAIRLLNNHVKTPEQLIHIFKMYREEFLEYMIFCVAAVTIEEIAEAEAEALF